MQVSHKIPDPITKKLEMPISIKFIIEGRKTVVKVGEK